MGENDLFAQVDAEDNYKKLLLEVQALKAKVTTARFNAGQSNRVDAERVLVIFEAETQKIIDKFEG